MNPVLKEVGDHVAAALPEDIVSVAQRLDELTVVAQAGSIAKVLAFLRDDDQCDFKCLVDVCGVDWPERERRFDVVYNLLSVKLNQRIRVRIETRSASDVSTSSTISCR